MTAHLNVFKLFTQLQIPAVVSDRVGVIQTTNDSFAHFYGGQLQDRRHELFDLIRPIQRNRFQDEWKRAVNVGATSSQELGWTFQRSSGSCLPVLVQHHVIDDFAILSTIKDLSLDDTAIALLSDDDLCNRLNISLIRKNTRFAFTYVNSNFCRDTGMSLHDVLGKTDREVYSHRADLADAYRADDVEVMESKNCFQAVEEHEYALPDGAARTSVPVHVLKSPLYDESMQLTGVRVLFWPLASQAKLLSALLKAKNESDLLLRSVFDNIPGFVYRKDTSLRFTFVDDKYCQHIGRPRQAILGKTDFDFFPLAQAEKYRTNDLFVITTGLAFQDIEAHRRPSDGSNRFMHVRKTPLRDEDGNIIGMQGFFWDETDRCIAERQTKNALVELNHRVKNSLQRVASYADLHAEHVSDPDARYVLDQLIRRIRATGEVHKRVLRSGNRTDVAPPSFLEDIVRWLSLSVEDRAANRLLVSSVEPVVLRRDTAVSCGLILNELIMNAIEHGDFSGPEPVVSVVVQTKLIEGRRHVSMSVSGPKSSSQGDGSIVKDSLGLSLISNLVAEIGGTLEQKTEDVRQTAVTFPLCEQSRNDSSNDP